MYCLTIEMTDMEDKMAKGYVTVIVLTIWMINRGTGKRLALHDSSYLYSAFQQIIRPTNDLFGEVLKSC